MVDSVATMLRGTAATQAYYEQEGWRPSPDGVPHDLRRWGGNEEGPIRRHTHAVRRLRVAEALAQAGTPLRLLECGCGGNPALDLLPICRHYTGLDFSREGLSRARERLSGWHVPFELAAADMCSLPFEDASFDAVYSSHALYHIAHPRGQAAALREMARVTRPGGVVVLIVANPRPLLFAGNLLRRVIADVPGLGAAVNRIRRAPIPYNPRSVRWMRRELEQFGRVRTTCYTLPSVWFNQRVSEHRGAGRFVWRVIDRLEREAPETSAPLGCYVQVSLRVGRR
jgi:ubiquinone/menaquinone biosynthesis C-methylase UbiE